MQPKTWPIRYKFYDKINKEYTELYTNYKVNVEQFNTEMDSIKTISKDGVEVSIWRLHTETTIGPDHQFA